jgi:hypothetical protein
LQRVVHRVEDLLKLWATYLLQKFEDHRGNLVLLRVLKEEVGILDDPGQNLGDVLDRL